MTQRELAARVGVPVSTVARIESGVTDPRTTTLARLLAICGEELVAVAAIGVGVDRSLIRTALEQSPKQRLLTLASAARAFHGIRGRARPRRPPR